MRIPAQSVKTESNSLEEVEAGTVHSPENVYTEYPDARRDEWMTASIEESSANSA
jgi:hypothetical protein